MKVSVNYSLTDSVLYSTTHTPVSSLPTWLVGDYRNDLIIKDMTEMDISLIMSTTLAIYLIHIWGGPQ